MKEQHRKAFDDAPLKALADASAALQVAGNGKPHDMHYSCCCCLDPACCCRCVVCVTLPLPHPWPDATPLSSQPHSPSSPQIRVKEQRRKAFDEAQRKALADASAALQAAGNGKSAAAATGDAPAAAAAASGEVLTAQDVAGAVAGSSSPAKPGGDAAGGKAAGPGKAELEARVAYLQEAAKNYDDPGTSSTVSSIVSVNVQSVCQVVDRSLLGLRCPVNFAINTHV